MSGFLRLVQAATLVVALCLPGDARAQSVDRPTASVRDSAGVRIVESAVPDTTGPPLWRLADEPSVSIGRTEGPREYVLERVIRPIRTERGYVVIASGGSELRFYDRAGRWITTVGGPDDPDVSFGGVRWISEIPGERILVFDSVGGELVILSTEGRLLDRAPLERAWGSALGTGTIVLSGGPPSFGELRGPALSLGVRNFRLLDPRTGVLRELVSSPGRVWLVPGGSASPHALSWSPGTIYWPGRDGVAVMWTGAPEVRVFEPDGRLRHIVRWAQKTERVAEDTVDNSLAGLSDEDRPRFREELERIGAVERQLFDRVVLADDGRLWVSLDRGRRDRGSRWLVFERDGRALGYVDFPRRLRIGSIGAESVLGVDWEDGVPLVRVYPFVDRRGIRP